MGTLVRCPWISKITPVPSPFWAAMVDTTWATANSADVPLIWLKASLKSTMTVLLPGSVAAERHTTLLGMAVVRLEGGAASALVGPASMEVMTEVRGAGASTTRLTATNCWDGDTKNTLTGTSEDGLGCVVVVTGDWGFSKPKGTRLAAMVLGPDWVGMAHPATASASRPKSARRRRLTTPLPCPRSPRREATPRNE